MSKSKLFELLSPFEPAGDQPEAINALCEGLDQNKDKQLLLGVTGSGKTFTIANVIQRKQKPTIVLAPNKTLAAQLYREFKDFFPNNAVEYFVSYYDYYQPEAYMPSSDTYIQKDASINDQIEQMRLSATKALLERKDVIVVATVSAIYGLGDPEAYLSMILHLTVGQQLDQRAIARRLAEMQYKRNDTVYERGTFSVKGDVISIFPADEAKYALRVHLFDGEVEEICAFDPLTSEIIEKYERSSVFPKTHYATPRDRLLKMMDAIKAELKERLKVLKKLEKHVEYQRLEERTRYDLEMIMELGYCSGIENYSRYLSGQNEGEPPPTLMNYLPENALLVIDESHVTVPQLRAMYRGDRSRKQTLVEYGFRLPSAMDNRPLMFEEFESISPQTIYVSATPSDYEQEVVSTVAELIIRPTGLLDPPIEIRPVLSQVDDLVSEINRVIKANERILVTTLTKKMSEDLSDYLTQLGIKVKYLHSDIGTIERVEIMNDLRMGTIDVIVGINLLREGLDLPEVSLVAILDADKEGFLRSRSSLTQTSGRAARNINGLVIMYADRITASIKATMDETDRRRSKQIAHNKKHGITPKTIIKSLKPAIQESYKSSQLHDLESFRSPKELLAHYNALEKQMFEYAEQLAFEEAAKIRDQLEKLKIKLINE